MGVQSNFGLFLQLNWKETTFVTSWKKYVKTSFNIPLTPIRNSFTWFKYSLWSLILFLLWGSHGDWYQSETRYYCYILWFSWWGGGGQNERELEISAYYTILELSWGAIMTWNLKFLHSTLCNTYSSLCSVLSIKVSSRIRIVHQKFHL